MFVACADIWVNFDDSVGHQRAYKYSCTRKIVFSEIIILCLGQYRDVRFFLWCAPSMKTTNVVLRQNTFAATKAIAITVSNFHGVRPVPGTLHQL